MNYPTKDPIFLRFQKAANKFAAIVAIFAAVVLAGCGGGGSLAPNGGGGGECEGIQCFLQDNNSDAHAAFAVANSVDKVEFGSITQSSGGYDSVDATVIVTAEGQLEVDITNVGASVAWSGITSTASGVASRTGILGSSDSSTRLTRVFNEGRLDMDVWASSVTSTNADDYLVGGVWLYLSNTGTLEVGSFADGVGIKVDMSRFSGNTTEGTEATYIGTANGIRLIGADVSYFKADVNLTLVFGSTSQVRGRIAGGGLPVLLLEPSDITLSGQFTGTFTTANTVYAGTWGGNFYGDAGESVAGIFGGGDGNVNNFRGWFGAENLTGIGNSPVVVEEVGGEGGAVVTMTSTEPLTTTVTTTTTTTVTQPVMTTTTITTTMAAGGATVTVTTTITTTMTMTTTTTVDMTMTTTVTVSLVTPIGKPLPVTPTLATPTLSDLLKFHAPLLEDLNNPVAVALAQQTFAGAVDQAPRFTSNGGTTQTGDGFQRIGVESLNLVSDQLQVRVVNTYTGPDARFSEISNVGGTTTAGGSFSQFALSDNVTAVGFIQPRLDGRVHLNVYASEIESTSATDYLVGGVWLYLSTTGADLQIGAFADQVGARFATTGSGGILDDFFNARVGSNPTGTATYSGNANGFRLRGDELLDFQADVNLTVNFNGAASTRVEGMITGGGLPNVILGSGTASFDNGSGDNRFKFNGSVTATGGYTGNWGGQFYGATGQAIGGTFGGSNAAGNDIFGGWFGTEVD